MVIRLLFFFLPGDVWMVIRLLLFLFLPGDVKIGNSRHSLVTINTQWLAKAIQWLMSGGSSAKNPAPLGINTYTLRNTALDQKKVLPCPTYAAARS